MHPESIETGVVLAGFAAVYKLVMTLVDRIPKSGSKGFEKTNNGATNSNATANTIVMTQVQSGVTQIEQAVRRLEDTNIEANPAKQKELLYAVRTAQDKILDNQVESSEIQKETCENVRKASETVKRLANIIEKKENGGS